MLNHHKGSLQTMKYESIVNETEQCTVLRQGRLLLAGAK